MATVSKGHHFIPQCYLRGFAAQSESPQLFVVDFLERKTFVTSPLNIAKERNFHTVDAPGQPPDVVEKALAEQFESELAPALLRIAERASLADDNDRGYLFFFMALLFIKNPQMRKRIGEWMGNIADYQLRGQAADEAAWGAKIAQAKSEGVLPPDADAGAMRKHILEGNFNYGVSVPGHMHFEFKLAPTLVPFFERRKWSVFRGQRDKAAFITSDNPVCLMWQDPLNPMDPGLGVPGTQIVFPVANEITIVGTFEGIGPSLVDADDDLVAVINGNILPHVGRQVYARDEEFGYAMPHSGGTKHGSDLLGDPVSQRNVE